MTFPQILKPSGKTLTHRNFINWMAIVLAIWLMVQSISWFFWLTSHEACTSAASKVGREAVSDGGHWPFLMIAATTAFLTASLWRLVARRSATLKRPPPPLHAAAGLYAVQVAAYLAADALMLSGCPTDTALGDNANASLIGPLVAMAMILSIASLGLAGRELFRLVRQRDPA